jgi:hypothetical protein
MWFPRGTRLRALWLMVIELRMFLNIFLAYSLLYIDSHCRGCQKKKAGKAKHPTNFWRLSTQPPMTPRPRGPFILDLFLAMARPSLRKDNFSTCTSAGIHARIQGTRRVSSRISCLWHHTVCFCDLVDREELILLLSLLAGIKRSAEPSLASASEGDDGALKRQKARHMPDATGNITLETQIYLYHRSLRGSKMITVAIKRKILEDISIRTANRSNLRFTVLS